MVQVRCRVILKNISESITESMLTMGLSVGLYGTEPLISGQVKALFVTE